MKDITYELIENYREKEGQEDAGLSSLLKEAEKAEPEGAWYFALAPERVAVFEWLPLTRTMTVLQLGAQMGVYSGLAGKTGRYIVADERPESLELIRRRAPGLMREAGGTLELSRTLPDCKCDVLLLPLFYPEANMPEDMRAQDGRFDPETFIRQALKTLKPGGMLAVAFDNGDGLKYAAGASPDEGRFLGDRKLVKRLFETIPFGKKEEYYPLPSAETAVDIYSSRFLPGAGSFRDVSESLSMKRYMLCDEAKLYGRLAETPEALKAFLPSYLLLFRDYQPEANLVRPSAETLAVSCGGTLEGTNAETPVDRPAVTWDGTLEGTSTETPDETPDESPDETPVDRPAVTCSGTSVECQEEAIYIRYNFRRKREYALRTQILEKEGKRYVKKTALYPEGDAHIDSFADKYRMLASEGSPEVRVLAPVLEKEPSGRSSAVFEYIEGKNLSDLLAEGICDGRAPEEQIRSGLNRLQGTENASCRNLDMLFENVLVKENRYYLCDYEWVFEEKLDLAFIKYRILKYWYDKHVKELYSYGDAQEFLSSFGLTPEETAAFEEKEQVFQESVTGKDLKTIRKAFESGLHTCGEVIENHEKLKEYTEWNLRLQDEVEEHKAALRKEREIERLSQNHIRNIEKILKLREEELERLNGEAALLRRHQSTGYKMFRKGVAAIDRMAPAGSRKRKLLHYANSTVRHPAKYLKLFLTAEGRRAVRGDLEIGGEFPEGGVLTLPACDCPRVSIIIPAYNEVAYTYACIRSVIAHTDAGTIPYEILLADDVSTDATAHIGDYIKGLVICRNEQNQGFLKNCNQAALKARGEFIFFLNNDTKVHEGWLEALVDLMDRDASVGMCGSKLVYPDGRLQEAGGIIWSDASGWNYGRLDDPSKPQYNYLRETDYISGAAILIRHSLWKEIGGFDERYAPAYCEDSDLAFEVRRHGYKVVYQPLSVVTHFEGISNGTDVQGTGLKRYQTVNMEKFREKWAKELAAQEENTGNPDPFTARDRSGRKACILVIDHYVPTYDRDAGSRTTWQYIRLFLKKGYNVKFIGDNFLHQEPYATELEQMGVEVLWGSEYRDGIYDFILKEKDRIDVAYINRPHIAVKYIDFLKENTNIRRIYYGHDLHFLRLNREYALTGEIRQKRDADYWKSVEFSVMSSADVVYYPSETEITAIKALHPEIPAKAVTAYMWDEEKAGDQQREGQTVEAAENTEQEGKPAGVAEYTVQEGKPAGAADYPKREGLLFVGGFAHPPNADGLCWFAEKVLPEIRQQVPGLKLYVAGSKPTQEVLALDGQNGIEILGFVTDERLSELYRTAGLVIVPLRYGAGVKGKVVEALHEGCAVVTTPVGAEGIPEADRVMKIAEEESFGAAVTGLLKDGELLEEMRKRAAGFAAEHYTPEAAWHLIREDFPEAEKLPQDRANT